MEYFERFEDGLWISPDIWTDDVFNLQDADGDSPPTLRSPRAMSLFGNRYLETAARLYTYTEARIFLYSSRACGVLITSKLFHFEGGKFIMNHPKMFFQTSIVQSSIRFGLPGDYSTIYSFPNTAIQALRRD